MFEYQKIEPKIKNAFFFVDTGKKTVTAATTTSAGLIELLFLPQSQTKVFLWESGFYFAKFGEINFWAGKRRQFS